MAFKIKRRHGSTPKAPIKDVLSKISLEEIKKQGLFFIKCPHCDKAHQNPCPHCGDLHINICVSCFKLFPCSHFDEVDALIEIALCGPLSNKPVSMSGRW